MAGIGGWRYCSWAGIRRSTRIARIFGTVALGLGVLVVHPSVAWASPSISNVLFAGNTSSNTITITGSGFGTTPPSGTSDDSNYCGSYSNNGEDYGTSLYIVDNNAGGGFQAGEGSPSTPPGACVGLIVDEWTATQIVLSFGNAYNTAFNWYIAAGNSYTMYVEGASFSGTVEFNTQDIYTAYVTNSGSSSVTPINTGTDTAGTPISVDAGPYGMAITPNGGTAYVAEYTSNTLRLINTATNTEGKSTLFSGTPGPIRVAISPDGATAYIANNSADTVTPFDIATNTAGTPISVGSAPDGIAVTPNGQTVYVANSGSSTVTPISTATNTPGTPISVGSDPSGVAITPDGATVYVANYGSDTVTPISTSNNTAGTPIPVGHEPRGIAITPNGATVYVGNGGSDTVTPISTTNNTPGTAISVGSNPFGIAITPDSATVYVANYGSDTVTPISTANNTPGTAISVGSDPYEVAITPDQGPQASLAVTPAPVGSATDFDASASVAPSSPIESYSWNFGDGQAATTVVPTTSHVYSSPGTYTASVTETDTAGASTTQVFTGQTVSLNGSSAAVASNTFTIVSCNAGVTCSAAVSSPDQSVSVTGTSTSTTTLSLTDVVATESCGTTFSYPSTVSTLTESNFTSSEGLAVTVTQKNEATAKGVKICYQPLTGSQAPFLLKKCKKSHPTPPCYKSITESGGSVIASFDVPAGDPRFWVGASQLGLTKFSPTSGAPGSTVTISGKSLGAVTGVTFGGTEVAATNLKIAANGKSLTVTVPDGALSGAIRVTGDGGSFPSTVSFTVT
ncbi:MAG TPA: beta-propeller fold lactonase family protein [Acidimicrobiales bacterium]|nr:beta-propeller fold lactonase family protein [Acidimicrobiales bacterium]